MNENFNKKVDKIEKFCSVAANCILKAPPPVWPVFILEGEWYLYPYFLRELHTTIKLMKGKGYGTEEIAKLFKNPSRITQFMYLFPGISFSDLSVKERIELVDNLLDYIAYYRKGDIFCENGKNILWSDNEIEEIIGKYELITPSNEDKNKHRELIGKINGSLFNYCEFLHLAKHPFGHEFHGPYKLSDNEVLIAREYYDLKPTLVWSFTKNLPFERVLTLEIYKGIDIYFDFFNHTGSSSSLPQHLQRFFIAIDGCGNFITKREELEKLLVNINKIFVDATGFTSIYTTKDWIQKLFEMHYYYLKPFKDILGLDWKPPEKQYKFLETKGISEDFLKASEEIGKKPKDESIRMLKDAFYNNIFGVRE